VTSPRAVILTGERGAGKTTMCLALAALSPRYRGLVSPPLVDGAGNRVGFAARCLATGEEWVLGRSDADLDGPRLGKFSFSSAGIARAVQCLRRVLALSVDGGEAGSGGDADPRQVVVVDEIGPLELEHGEGFAPVLPLLAAAGHLVLVVRPSLTDAIAALVPRHEREVVTLTRQRRRFPASSIDDLFA
jgi:nucleoside-triphosphatase THEP1